MAQDAWEEPWTSNRGDLGGTPWRAQRWRAWPGKRRSSHERLAEPPSASTHAPETGGHTKTSASRWKCSGTPNDSRSGGRAATGTWRATCARSKIYIPLLDLINEKVASAPD